ncbi:hypothetical protein MRX96_032431 [Rhipicephalus microplus]
MYACVLRIATSQSQSARACTPFKMRVTHVAAQLQQNNAQLQQNNAKQSAYERASGDRSRRPAGPKGRCPAATPVD